MKKVLVALVCTLGAAACGERRPAEDPSTTSTSVTTETTTVRPNTNANANTNANKASGATPATSSAPRTTTTGSADGLDTTRPVRNEAMSGAATGGAGSTAAATGGTATGSTAPSTDNPGVADGTKDATNTKINDRDRHGALTPMDQGGGADRDITAAIRRSVVADKALSFTAKNVKIITVGGKVTLRGPVKSDDEKSAIEAKAKAKAAPGVSSVDNQLEVKK